MVGGPVSPSCASSAASRPERHEDPAQRRLTSPPLLSYSIPPPASLPAIPKALTRYAAVRLRIRPAPAAAP